MQNSESERNLSGWPQLPVTYMSMSGAESDVSCMSLDRRPTRKHNRLKIIKKRSLPASSESEGSQGSVKAAPAHMTPGTLIVKKVTPDTKTTPGT